MTIHYQDDQVTLHHGDALNVLRTMPEASIDAICTDPPYGLEFMGKDWDSFGRDTGNGYHEKPRWTSDHMGKGFDSLPNHFTAGRPFQRWCEQWATECLRVLKPGAHLVAFGGTRTHHRLTCAIEDAGFEIRDSVGVLGWIHGQGFPKSLNLGDGRGTALKPAWEPIILARKPLAGTVANNAQAYGTGALNVDACRIDNGDRDEQTYTVRRWKPGATLNAEGGTWRRQDNDAPTVTGTTPPGRWPTNVALLHAPLLNEQAEPIGDACADGCVEGCPVAEMDAQSGVLTSGVLAPHHNAKASQNTSMSGPNQAGRIKGTFDGDSGGASRFFPVFRYEPKAPTSERPRTTAGVAHPTVKPLDLMRWLVRLITPPSGLVLDPFVGSGTTAEACVIEGFRCIAIERDATYLPLVTMRLTKPLQPVLDLFGEDGAA